MEVNNELKILDLAQIWKKLWSGKMLYVKVLVITFIVSSIFIVGYPRFYQVEIKLAPEMGANSENGLNSLISAFGFNFDNMKSSDAISPLLYPELIDDNGFVSSFLDVPVVSQDGKIKTIYRDYLKNYQDPPLWAVPFNWLKEQFSSSDDDEDDKVVTQDPYALTKEENSIYEEARKNTGIGFNKKTGVITINVTAQDPLICKTMGDSITEKLQYFITRYRTNKARIDCEYYQKLTDAAKKEYDTACDEFTTMSDAYLHITMQSTIQHIRNLEKEMQLKYTTYTSMHAQLEAARAKVQERTPAFTIIKGASVPLKPSGPKRMIFVALMMLLALLGTSAYILVRR